MKNPTQKLPSIGFFALVFGFLFLWFSRIHPLVPFDGDDWTYLSYVRLALPNPQEWNPAKVFPEILYPFFSSIAAFAVMPLTRDYVTSQTIVHALVVSAFITGYLWCFAGLIRRLFSLSRMNTFLLTIVFLALHFWCLRCNPEGNIYLLASKNVNCYYNYQLPVLLNASFVMYFLENPRFDAFLVQGRPELRGLFLVVLYLAIFSNLPACGILAAYAGARLLLALIREGKSFRFGTFVKANWFSLGILAAWFLCAGFELSGDRAAYAVSDTSLLHRFRLTLYYLKDTLVTGTNRGFQITALLLLLASLICILRGRKTAQPSSALASVTATVLIAGAAFGVYMVILCTVVDPRNITTCDYLLCLFFYFLLLLMLALASFLKRYPGLSATLPLLTLFLISAINTPGRTFVDIDPKVNMTSEQCAAIIHYIIDQFQQADADGLDCFTLYIPQCREDPQTEGNWPFSEFLMHRISGTLYAHRLISRPIDVIPVIDTAINEQFHLSLP